MNGALLALPLAELTEHAAALRNTV